MLCRRGVFVFEGDVCELALGALAVDVALTAFWPSFDFTTCRGAIV